MKKGRRGNSCPPPFPEVSGALLAGRERILNSFWFFRVFTFIKKPVLDSLSFVASGFDGFFFGGEIVSRPAFPVSVLRPRADDGYLFNYFFEAVVVSFGASRSSFFRKCARFRPPVPSLRVHET